MTLQNVELGLRDDDSYDENNTKFNEHETQWRLNKRGVNGESVVHLLLGREEPSCAEIARILISKYPGLAKDIYLGDDQFGEWRSARRTCSRRCARSTRMRRSPRTKWIAFGDRAR